MTGQRLLFIDGLRGYAALAVAVFHLVDRDHSPLPRFLTAIAGYGDLGVFVFFAISGFVMVYRLEGEPIDARYGCIYVLRRIVRLDPAMYAAIAASLVLNAILMRVIATPNPALAFPGWPTIFANMFYLQNFLGYKNLVMGLWSLCIEAQFYVALLVVWWLLQGRREKLRGPVIFFSGAITLPLYQWMESDAAGWMSPYVSLLPNMCLFAPGMLASLVLFKRCSPAWLWTLLALTAIRMLWKFDAYIFAAAVAGLAIYVAGRRDMMRRWLADPFSQYLGRISYSFYLMHALAGFTTIAVLKKLGIQSSAVHLIAGLLAALAAATILFYAVERPSHLASRMLKLKEKAPAAAVSG